MGPGGTRHLQMPITFNSDELFRNGFNESKLEVLGNVTKTNLVPKVYIFYSEGRLKQDAERASEDASDI